MYMYNTPPYDTPLYIYVYIPVPNPCVFSSSLNTQILPICQALVHMIQDMDYNYNIVPSRHVFNRLPMQIMLIGFVDINPVCHVKSGIY